MYYVCRGFTLRNAIIGLSLRLLTTQLALVVPVVHLQSCSAPSSNNIDKKVESCTTSSTTTMASEVDYKAASSIYDFTVKDSFGNDVKLDKYKDQVVLVVNVASKCGLTKNNYAQLTELKQKYEDKGLSILSFPCNQFASQMPVADGEAMVCHLKEANADIGDVFAKVDVNGDKASPLWKYLKHKQTGTLGSGIKWNFTKFLVDKNGQPVERFAPTTEPKDIVSYIDKLL